VKAVVMDRFGAADVLRLDEVPMPKPAAGQLLIQVAASSVNRPDIVQRQGNYPPPPGHSEILGLECAGTVAETGAGVESFAVGERVFALLGGGGYAEYAVVDARHALPVPDSLRLEQAACIAETYITAYLNLFEIAGLVDGQSVLLHGGGGGVNTAAIQLVKALSPASPIVVTASAAKRERVLELGADLVIDYGSSDFAAETLQFTGGRGVDVILDHIGAAYFDANLKALAVEGRLVVIGVMQGSSATLNLGRLLVKRHRIIGSVLRPRSDTEKAGIIARFGERVLPLFASGRIAPLIDSRFALAEAREAHRHMEASRHFGKIVLTVSG
jgi:putative PIG3 family NAD(P)H quinone oxidoreductase